MELKKISNTIFGLMIVGLLTGIAHDALAQRTIGRSERRSDGKRPARTMVKKDKITKRSGKQIVRKDHASKSVRSKEIYSKKQNRKNNYRDSQKVRKNYASKPIRSKTMYSKKGNRKKDYRDSRKHRNSYNKDRKHFYNHRSKKHYYPRKKTWQRRHYRKPVWRDYYRPAYRYPRIGMHVSVLPHGFFSFRIGKLRFYAYRGVYYSWDPALRVYVVVNKPLIETRYTSATWDSITLMDGSTIEGIYRYIENDILFFEVGDALLEIPMSEIKLLSLA
jgi:hypothetical protein